ncbi:MAG: hydroxymethylglutaryl-CoA reductase [Chitinophagales bacterium]
MKEIKGFSKLSKEAKLEWAANTFFSDPESAVQEYSSYWHPDKSQQKLFDEFSENTVSNFVMPYGLAPNFLINGKLFCIPMVIEESSVVAAACKSAKFWLDKGGFKAEVISTTKIGQIHFIWNGSTAKLRKFITDVKPVLLKEAVPLTRNMEARGGGILDIELVDMTDHDKGYHQLKVHFETCDSMGANFINSVLEKFAATLKQQVLTYPNLQDEERDIRIIMSILSNYTPECKVRVSVSCPVEQLAELENGLEAEDIAERFSKAVMIAKADPHRATTHNKGVFNGIDAVVLATGNDFRAVEACGHTYAARSGKYTSLTDMKVEHGIFEYYLEVPMALGTVGGLTNLHPMVKRSMEMLGNPGAPELMMIAATAGLANNFGALRSLVTTGIQKGHMKMHLLNILNSMDATMSEVKRAKEYFKDHVVSYRNVCDFLETIRSNKPELL